MLVLDDVTRLNSLDLIPFETGRGSFMKLKRRKTQNGFIYIFWCPGCNEQHTFDVRPGEWEFNGNWDNPSFSPSLNLLPQGGRCHLFLKDGIIDFLGDCNHHLNNQKIPLVDFP